MAVTKPTASTKWATDGTALKLSVTLKQENFGWTTSTGTVSGVPEKPLLQYENGWRWAVNQWLKYLEAKTDEQTPDQTGKSGLFLQSANGVPTWSAVYPEITAANVTARHVLVASTAATSPDTTKVTWGYPWNAPAALASPNEFSFLRWNGTAYSFESPFPAFSGNGSKALKLSADAGSLSWQTIYEVQTPSGTGQILTSTGALPGGYSWAAPSFAGSVITSGTVGAARLPVYVGASAGAAGTQGVVPAAAAGDQAKYLTGAGTWSIPTFDASAITSGTLDAARLPAYVGASASVAGTNGAVPAAAAGDQAKYLSGAGTWLAITQMPSPGAASTILVSNGTSASWTTLTEAQIPSLSASKIVSGSFAQGLIPAFSGATSGAQGSLGGVPVAIAGDQGKFLRADATWQAVPVVGKLDSGATGIAADFSLYNVVNATALTGSTTFSFLSLGAGRIVTFAIKATTGTVTITWPAGIKWADGLPLTSATTSVALVTIVSLGTTASDCYATVVRAFS